MPWSQNFSFHTGIVEKMIYVIWFVYLSDHQVHHGEDDFHHRFTLALAYRRRWSITLGRARKSAHTVCGLSHRLDSHHRRHLHDHQLSHKNSLHDVICTSDTWAHFVNWVIGWGWGILKSVGSRRIFMLLQSILFDCRLWLWLWQTVS